MNTHKLLSDWHGHPEYGTIAKYANAVSKYVNDPDKILEMVSEKFEKQNFLVMNANHAPLNILGDVGTQIPENAVEQMETALRIPSAVRGALMPDAHYGYAVPIGAVVVLDNAIHPSFIGFDIGCSVSLSVLDVDVDYFLANREWFGDVLIENSKFKFAEFDRKKDHAVMSDSRWGDSKVIKGLKRKAQDQLGTSGGGNHFCDLVIIDSISTEFPEGRFVGLLTHSGSRGAGHKFATHYTRLADKLTAYEAKNIPTGYGWLDMDTEAGQEYWDGMQLLGEYALANHDVIHRDYFRAIGTQELAHYESQHNLAWIENGEIVHRKGATPSFEEQIGLVPGTSGTNSQIVVGLGNEDFMNSSAHGAGRPHSRTKAKELHDQVTFEEHMAKNDIMYYGLNTDETFMSYKDIDSVMELQEGVVANSIATMKPSVVLMGGNEEKSW